MTTNQFLSKFREKFDQPTQRWLLNALIREPVIWESLVNTSLGDKALEKFSTTPEAWTPAAIALLALEEKLSRDNDPLTLRNLCDSDWEALGPEPHQIAEKHYQAWIAGEGNNQTSIEEAGWIALAVRERRVFYGKWNFVEGHLSTDPIQTRLVLSCVAGMLPNPLELISVLLKANLELGVHVFLCQPYPPDEQMGYFAKLIDKFSDTDRLEAIQLFGVLKPGTTTYLPLQSDQTANAEGCVQTTASYAWLVDPVSDTMNKVRRSVQEAKTLRVQDQGVLSIKYLEKALLATRRLQGYLSSQIATSYSMIADDCQATGLAGAQTDNLVAEDLEGTISRRQESTLAALQAWEGAIQLDPEQIEYRCQYAWRLLSEDRLVDAQAILSQLSPDQADFPYIYWAAQTRLAIAMGKEDQAWEFLQEAIKNNATNLLGVPAFYQLAKIVFNAGFFAEAAQLTHLVLAIRPDDADALILQAQAQIMDKQPDQALNSACLAYTLQPTSVSHQLFIQALEANSAWASALEERKRIIDGNNTPQAAGLLTLAACAVQAGEPEVGLSACNQALAINPENGLVYEMLGEIALAEGQPHEALNQFHKAVQFSPGEAITWLSLARLLNQLGQDEERDDQKPSSLEILRQACQAAPESPEVHLELGLTLLKEDSHSQALIPLRRASELVSRNPTQDPITPQVIILEASIVKAYGDTLRELGYLEYSCRTFEKFCCSPAKKKYVDPWLSYSFAQTLFALGDSPAALPWLSIAASAQNNPRANLDYARTLLNTSTDNDSVQAAVENLEFVVSQNGSNSADILPTNQFTPAEIAEVYALLAEALRQKGDLNRSLAAYRQALDSSLIQQANWRHKLSLGLGEVALLLGKHETAIAAFLESEQIDPSDPVLYRRLAEAYAAIGLTADAFQNAQQANRLDAQNPGTLGWYVDLILQLQEQPDGKGLPLLESARQALEKAVLLVPERADLIVRLAEVQLRCGDPISMLQTLDAITNNPDENLQITTNDLLQAASLLREIGRSAQAAVLIGQAINLEQVEQIAQDSKSTASLFYLLAQVYRDASDPSQALAAIDQAIVLESNNTAYLRLKSNLLVEMGDFQQALACLDDEAKHTSEPWEVSTRSSLVHYSLGQFSQALLAAEQAVQIADQEATMEAQGFFSHWLAGMLAFSVMDNERAGAYLDCEERQATLSLDAIDNSNEPYPVPPFAEYACLKAELALLQDDRVAAISGASSALASILETYPRHPHLLALQSRLLIRQEGLTDSCLQLLEASLEIAQRHADLSPEDALRKKAETDHLFSSNHQPFDESFYRQQAYSLMMGETWSGLAEAAIELNHWADLMELCNKTIEFTPESPAGQMLLVRAIIKQAECYRLCQSLTIVNHSPTASSINLASRSMFETALLKAADRIDVKDAHLVNEISRWRLRGSAIFAPDIENTQMLSSLIETRQANGLLVAEDIAALFWTIQNAGFSEDFQPPATGMNSPLDMLRDWADNLPKDPLVCLTNALLLAETQPDRALHILRQSLDHLTNLESCLANGLPNALPVLNAAFAIIAHRYGRDTHQSALGAIEAAIKIWPNEARWHELAADILLATPTPEQPSQTVNTSSAGSILYHLRCAVDLEPNNPAHHLKIGRFYADNDDLVQAQEEYEKATRCDPELGEPWLALARLQKETGQLEKAINSADNAIALLDRSIEAWIEAALLRCELALLTNNPRGALSRSQAILNVTPEQPLALYYLAQAYEQLGQPDEALSAIEHAITLADSSLELELLRIRLVWQVKGASDSLIMARQLTEVYPEDASLQTLLADLSAEVGEFDQAVSFANTALRNGNGTLPLSTRSRLHLMIGVKSRQDGHLDQAIYHLNEAIQNRPDNIEAYLELGRAHQERRQNYQALEIYQMAAKILPNDYRPYYQAGLALKDNKDYMEAETMFRRAAHLAPNEVGVHRQLAAVVALNLVHNRRVAA